MKAVGSKNVEEPGRRTPVFEMVVLGAGGGPLETDCSGYLVKPYDSGWEEGMVSLEGGSGLGALATLLETRGDEMFPNVTFPPEYNTAILKAAYIFSYLTCYLITHAHLDHTLSLIMLSGSVPPRPTIAKHSQPPIPPTIPIDTALPPKTKGKAKNEAKAVVPVFGTKETLERLSSAYGGGLWPELGHWASWQVTERKQQEDKKEEGKKEEGKKEEGKTRSKKRKAAVLVEDVKPSTSACGVALTPLAASEIHRPLHPCLPITTLTYPVAHGCTSHGLYESSAVFIRYDPAALSDEPEPEVGKGEGYREFLFFGDVESEYRKAGDEDIGTVGKEGAARMNRTIWEEAARGWNVGRLAGVFIECSYDSDRPASLMFGHISPHGLYHEMKTLASLIKEKEAERPLNGLKIYVTHIKEALIPHESGKSARERILEELIELEKEGQLGVEFIAVQRGDRILI